MTDLDLDAIEARANAATPGPWANDRIYTTGGIVHNDKLISYMDARKRLNSSVDAYWERYLSAPLGQCIHCRYGEPVRVDEGTYLVAPNQAVLFNLTKHSHFVPYDVYPGHTTHPVYAADGHIILEDSDYDIDPNYNNNATFAAHARTDVPALVAEVRRLRAELSGRICGYDDIPCAYIARSRIKNDEDDSEGSQENH